MAEHIGEDWAERIRATRSRIRLLGVTPLDLQWGQLADDLVRKLSENPDFTIEILCESDDYLFNKALLSDTPQASVRTPFSELLFKKERVAKERPKEGEDPSPLLRMLRERGAPLAENDDSEAIPSLRNVRVETIYLDPAILGVEFDGTLFVAEWLDSLPREYRECSDADAPYRAYFEQMFTGKAVRKYCSPPGKETLELFDHEPVPRGIYPRSSFYDTDNSQLVIWGIVFDRKGRLLIHRRAENAKDNREMWDKSVGGHVDFSQDPNSARAMARELVEELFTDEIKRQVGDHGLRVWNVRDDDVVFLGDWRKDRRTERAFGEISQFKKEWAFFSLPKSVSVYSPRTLPNGDVRRLRVIADVYFFVGGPGLDDGTLGKLKNSTFKLLLPSELKTAMDQALAGHDVPGFDENRDRPLFSPDLVNIMTGDLRDAIGYFSQFVRHTLIG